MTTESIILAALDGTTTRIVNIRASFPWPECLYSVRGVSISFRFTAIGDKLSILIHSSRRHKSSPLNGETRAKFVRSLPFECVPCPMVDLTLKVCPFGLSVFAHVAVTWHIAWEHPRFEQES